ncbi:hypothetical protein PLICRDRAFT_695749 [Plicaturopsis crispa FD-325 SS-3]|nr:hypothetical protein PLICRDRAFT_695749 [Plicaturopsis crispa FD-325 SS-3]
MPFKESPSARDLLKKTTTKFRVARIDRSGVGGCIVSPSFPHPFEITPFPCTGSWPLDLFTKVTRAPPILASVFRNGAPSPRLAPPSSFPSALQSTPSHSSGSTRDTLNRRVSRTDLDFEKALSGGGTVMLKEGVDVNSLGVDTSPSPMSHEFASPTPPPKESRRGHQPSTPGLIPPTPSPSAGPSSARMPAQSASTSSNDVFFDAEDSDHQTKRRSMYRSPGTASSPDLATLLRKAKAKGGIVGSQHRRETPQEAPPPLPSGGLQTGRPRSSTGQSISSTPSTPNATPGTKGRLLKPTSSRDMGVPGSPEWVLTSRASRSSMRDAAKSSKTSVRAKTSAFLGKMLGQGTVRERSKTDVSMSPGQSQPSIFGAFTPPVPPLPTEHQPSSSEAPATPTIADVFSSSVHGTPDTAKPLPPILLPQKTGDSVGSDISTPVMDNGSPQRRPRPPSEQTLSKSPTVKSPDNGKRRSMSVGEIELQRAMTAASLTTSLPRLETNGTPERPQEPKAYDTTLSGIMSDFQGELSQLESFSGTSLDLKDPCTPARRAALSRSHTDSKVLPFKTSEDGGARRKTSTSTSSSAPGPSAAPALTLETAFLEDDREDDTHPRSPSLETPVVPPRSSSLNSPLHRPASATSSSPPVTVLRHGSSPLRLRNGIPVTHAHTSSRDSARLRVQHRSTASSSEPSLIPVGDDRRVRIPAYAASSQQDLTTKDLTLSPFPSSHSPARGEDKVDIQTRGRELASRCWAEDEEFLAKEKIAEWLGSQGRLNSVALHYYMDYFNFKGLRLDHAFRRLCAKLFLKAETQQVDRILDTFSRRYWECNPGGLYGSASIVHSVAYSLLLLNTDLHVAELSSRMSRSQFVRNTLSTIQMELQPSRFTQISSSDLTYDDCGSIRGSGSDGTETIGTRSKRSASITSWNSISKDTVMSSPGVSLASSSATQVNSGQPSDNGSATSVHLVPDSKTQNSSTTSVVYGRNWEMDMENLLKEMYNAVKSQQILQPLGSALGARGSATSLSPGGHNLLRNRSSRGPPDRLATLKRGSIRGIQSILGAPNSTSPYSSNSSIDGRVSPSPSLATSAHDGVHGAYFTPALGFASNLSHTIIRETQEDDDHHSVHSQESGSTTISITDEELALLGAPWAKEGMLCRKQYWESVGKRAKDKAWLDVFVVIQQGELNMFIFGEHGGGGSGVVGGGNWLENADSVGTVQLAHSLAHVLPPPGYNRQRPHCMVLTLSNGGVYFFQAGTEELVNEWVSTCNYWAARTSKEPLAGGVSNMEYGWNRVVEDTNHARSHSDTESRDDFDTMSVKSGRSARSRFGWKEGAATLRAPHSPWNDRVYINDWKPPLPPSVSSVHDEESQLEALRKHVSSMKQDLQRHNELRQNMMGLYQPRSSNAIKAQSNWEKKSQYLLTEIVKYESYISSLQAAMSLRLKKRGEKALERALVVASPDDEEDPAAMGKWKGFPDEETIEETDEPPITPLSSDPHKSHRRERAETD